MSNSETDMGMTGNAVRQLDKTGSKLKGYLLGKGKTKNKEKSGEDSKS